MSDDIDEGADDDGRRNPLLDNKRARYRRMEPGLEFARIANFTDAVYAIADAQLTEHLGAFARAGVGDGPITAYADAGLRGAPFAKRDDLVTAGIAFARSDAGAQTIVETTYEVQIRWVSIQPAAQVLLLPGRTVGIAAVRTTVTF